MGADETTRGSMRLGPAPTSAPASIRATLNYSIDTGETPVTETTGPGGRLRRRSGGRDDAREVEIRDARGQPSSLDREGYVLVEHDTALEEYWDEDALRRVVYPEIEALVAALSGAARVVIFDHTLRSQDPARQVAHFAREPVEVVHNDYTERSGPWRLADVLPDEALRQGRFAIIQVWRPIAPIIEAYPLALCRADSVADGDWIPAERRHPNRVGEIYQLSFNPAHRWVYFPRMRRREALVFKVYDSMDDGRARFTPHTSFVDPTSPANAPSRESVEFRTLALF